MSGGEIRVVEGPSSSGGDRPRSGNGGAEEALHAEYVSESGIRETDEVLMPEEDVEEFDTSVTDSELPCSSVAISQQEEYCLSLQKSASSASSPRNRRSPMRGVLRAVSSLTITDIEALEVGIANLRDGYSKEPMKVRSNGKYSPTPISCDQSPTVPLRSPADHHNRPSFQHPRRGNSRRRRAGPQCPDYPGDEVVDQPAGVLLPTRPPFLQEEMDRSCFHMDNSTNMKRRKSFDLLPNVPRRVSSDKDLVELGEESDPETPNHCPAGGTDDDAEIERFINTLHEHVHIDSPEPPTRDPPTRHRSKSFDLLPGMPRRNPVAAAAAAEDDMMIGDDFFIGTPIDRFSSEPHPAINLLKRHQSLDQMLPPRAIVAVNPIIPRGGDDCPDSPPPSRGCLGSESSEPESSPFRVREFVVSLDYLEDQKNRGDAPKRRPSIDALPTPPRRFSDEVAGLDIYDTDDDEAAPDNVNLGGTNNNNNGSRRPSFEDIPVKNRRPSHEEMLLDGVVNLVYDIDHSHRTQIVGRFDHHRDSSDDEKPERRKSFDILPSLPRRRFESESSSDSDISPIPLKTVDGNPFPRRPVSDVLPSAPRRINSGVTVTSHLSKCSSHSLNEIVRGETNQSDEEEEEEYEYEVCVKTSDRLPSLPIRESSLPSINLDSFSAKEKKEDLSQDSLDVDLEADLESCDGGDLVGGDATTSQCITLPLDPTPTAANSESSSSSPSAAAAAAAAVEAEDNSESAETSGGEIPIAANDDYDGTEEAAGTTEESLQLVEEENSPKHPVRRRKKKKSSLLVRLFAARSS